MTEDLPSTLNAINTMLLAYDFKSNEEMDFVTHMCAEYSEIAERFAWFATVPAADRLQTAVQKLHTEPRTGWLLRHIPAADVQSIADHIACGIQLFNEFSNTLCNIKQAKQMFLVHDLPEVFISDFHIYASIQKEDKHRLEAIVIRLLYQHSVPHAARAAFDYLTEYQQIQTPEAKLCKDIDLLETLLQFEVYFQKYPSVLSYDEFYNYAAIRLQTSAGKDFFNQLAHSHPAIHALKHTYSRTLFLQDYIDI